MDQQGLQRPRLKKLIIKNFRSIGRVPVEIELDEIVVLVGPNNVGKSSILRAYEVVMSDGSKKSQLTLDDFPNGEVNSEFLPEIELQTIVYDNTPGEKWIDDTSGEKLVRECWTWSEPGKPKRRGFNVIKGDWDDDSVPWGAANVANSRRPQPHRVDAFQDPIDQTNELVKMITSILQDRVKSLKVSKEESDYVKLLNSIKEIQRKIIQDSQEEITRAQDGISEILKEVFPGYKVIFDARPEEDLDKSISLFKAGSKLLIGPETGYRSTVDRQGSGARRTLLWASLRYISESSTKNDRPHVLLLDEPELCLHPNAVREACKVLYDLPKKGNWQVMVTTHSPAFIDLSRDNTTIIRVERNTEGNVEGTTVFRPSKVQLHDEDKKRLKLLNICDPHVTEFFFGGYSIIVEGDTEYTALKQVIASNDSYKDIHIIRARGKATIVSLMKILNHFGSKYSILHDSDYPTLESGNRNSAWTVNQNILNEKNNHIDPSKIRLIASMKNFESAFLEKEVKEDKPYNALVQLNENPKTFSEVELLLKALIDHEEPVPSNCLEWYEIEELERFYLEWEQKRL
ncbi:ATP-dependent nuclease [Bacillus paralicheniformis]|uniref:DNA replication and repair protein RecF n=1 Tax=Bacillus paralicheniformis TaxID=1648923 RepID=A0ABY3G191_9BACI|nr:MULTISPECIES: AAA family ATPase [Bacillus]MED1742218.1 AAA family ATPase [Bacillus swezeyi]TWL44403.1 DNA replication and repair protein RecF [Bacillus paralicheniformis]WEZ22396.1 AAA family ATPase [Bacillus paralicheniformis]